MLLKKQRSKGREMKQSGKEAWIGIQGESSPAAIRGDQRISELDSRLEVHPTLINNWKKQLTEGAPGLFSSGHTKQNKSQ
ncbi:MAG: hypothetical protein CL709_04115 [Chloroflexi bacterium]|nr:hypothetical protein [Chloroflexota bacterium]